MPVYAHLSRFRLCQEHVRLVRAARVVWDDSGPLGGVPTVDPFDPYGGYTPSPEGILRAAGLDIGDRVTVKRDRTGNLVSMLPRDLMQLADTLHRQTVTALQVVLSSGSFEPGVYRLCWDEEGRPIWRRRG